jgi:hypothetical protein
MINAERSCVVQKHLNISWKVDLLMKTRLSKRTLAIAVLFAATAAAILFIVPAPSHAVHSQAVSAGSSHPALAVKAISHPSAASNVLASTGANQPKTISFTSTHGPCMRCLYAHPYSAEVLGLAPLTSPSA